MVVKIHDHHKTLYFWIPILSSVIYFYVFNQSQYDCPMCILSHEKYYFFNASA